MTNQSAALPGSSEDGAACPGAGIRRTAGAVLGMEGTVPAP